MVTTLWQRELLLSNEQNGACCRRSIPGLSLSTPVNYKNILKSVLVLQVDSKWHHIVPSIVAMHEKLVCLGFVYYNGEIYVVELEENRKYV